MVGNGAFETQGILSEDITQLCSPACVTWLVHIFIVYKQCKFYHVHTDVRELASMVCLTAQCLNEDVNIQRTLFVHWSFLFCIQDRDLHSL